MRDEREMLELIVGTAARDDRIRAVILCGSRANPDAPRDEFQDFDVVYVVTDVEPFKSDPTWIDRFGKRTMLQTPDAMLDPPPDGGPGFAYLMLFEDGNRIDLTLFPVDRVDEMKRDSFSLLLLDKDGRLEPFDPPSDALYRRQSPTEKQFSDCCNEFWWVCQNAAKGLAREELLYARVMLEGALRPQLMKMLTWKLGETPPFRRHFGAHEKYLPRWLEPELWSMLAKTYPNLDRERMWEALFTMGDLFRIAAYRVGHELGFAYPQDDDDRMTRHLRRMRR